MEIKLKQNKMKLATIYNVFSDSLNLLEESIKSIEHISDYIIIVYSNYSNAGEYWECKLPEYVLDHHNVIIRNTDDRCMIPKSSYAQISACERFKRQTGIEVAKDMNCSHFLLIDSDEVYDVNEVEQAWNFIKANHQLFDATYVRLYTYFLDKNVRLKGHDGYAVPFICKLRSNLKLEGTNWGMDVDPTRCYKTRNNKLIDNVSMHHYSWIRDNYLDKVKHSTSKDVIDQKIEDLKWDIENSINYMYSRFYNKKLERV